VFYFIANSGEALSSGDLEPESIYATKCLSYPADQLEVVATKPSSMPPVRSTYNQQSHHLPMESVSISNKLGSDSAGVL